MMLSSIRRIRTLSVALLALAVCSAGAQETRQALKVCADPNNMPLSNEAGEGYENRIARLLAERLGLPLEYTWFPQRRGFVRKTLRERDPETNAYRCDLIIGVPSSFELAITTEPYYRSTYALVFNPQGKLAGVDSPQDLIGLPEERRRALRIGVFEQTPGAVWLAKNGMIRQIVPYITLNADPAAYPGQIIEQGLLSEHIDAAILWGPIAGYFVKKSQQEQGVELKMLAMRSGDGLRFDFPISMAVRFGEDEWKQQLEQLIADNKSEIEAILAEYNVPLVDAQGQPL